MAAMLSLVMMAGVFAGMKLDVRAAETREIDLKDYSDLEGEKRIYYDNITSEDIFSIHIPISDSAKLIWNVGIVSKSDFTLYSEKYSLNEYLEKGKSYKLKVIITRDSLPNGTNTYKIKFYFYENK